MKFTLSVLVFFSLQANAALECKLIGERKYQAIIESLVMEGKGTREINDILQARLKVCRGKCVEGISSSLGLCMADVKPKE